MSVRALFIRWSDLNGVRHEKLLDGAMALCLQHEIGHLDGVLFTDRLFPAASLATGLA